MLTNYGFNSFLKALGKPFQCRFYVSGGRVETLYDCDPGYPKLDDKDEANGNRGEYVLTWRYTIPRGTDWGNRPASEVELIENGNIVDHMKIPDLHTSKDHSTVLYLNLMLRK